MGRAYPFYTASLNALDAITRLYDFIWPTAAAVWNLRWQVLGYSQVRGGDPSVDELQARFVEGSGIHGANLHRACLERTWDQQRSDLAFVTLVNLFAVYESWTGELFAEIGASASATFDPKKALQFPSSTKNGKQRGIGPELAHLTSAKSPAMLSDVHPCLASRAGVHPRHVEEMLVIYRYFKECRNSLMHVGGRASQQAVDASTAIGGVGGLPFPIPKHGSLVLEQPVVLDLYGVVGFSDVLRRLVLTLDAELTSTTVAERMLVDRWRKECGVVQCSSQTKKRHAAIRRHLKKVGLPPLPNVAGIEGALKTAGLLR